MARPARVRMRRRKPCVLARRRLFGWKVRLLTRFSVGCRVRSDITMTSARLPFWGWRWPMRPQSASPWRVELVRLGRARGHGHAKEVADTLGQRYGSRGTRVKPAEPPRGSGPKPTIFRGRTAIARRHAAEPEICGRLDCLSRVCACRFSSSRSSPPQCTGCGQTCGQQGIVHRDTDASKTSDPAHRSPARAESSRDTTECNRHDSGAGGIRWPRQASITRRSGSRRSAPSTRWGCRTRSARSSGSAASSACSTRPRWCEHPTPSPRTSSSSASASRSTTLSPVSSGTRSSSRCRSTRASRPTWG